MYFIFVFVFSLCVCVHYLDDFLVDRDDDKAVFHVKPFVFEHVAEVGNLLADVLSSFEATSSVQIEEVEG